MLKKLALLVVSFLAILPVFGETSVTLAWNPNAEENVIGYRLYWGTESRSYLFNLTVPAPQTQATVTGLLPGVTYFFAVTAFTNEGLESDYSDEVSYTIPVPPSLSYSSADKTVRWPVVAGFVDLLEVSEDLVIWSQVPVAGYSLDSGWFSFPMQVNRFYRLRREGVHP